ncbi:hypothetical protein WS105_0827 [Weissella ceti]|uniref:UPF0291 protein WS74_0766 n=3 Tax=Lactobacillaceae TaxID=33958 RepID=A0A075U6D9_9LACO|nr:hypothetical protein WS08_0763 [Weissella tructae]AIM63018.1 hypothetical protein WS74_0766 [Weissella ceti]AIM64417.1 hypothetical protein WS105_0827 [Weissella ceti]ELA06845.1 hypothetical protein WCNC_04677 [Weissella ceti NC36]
MTDENKVVEPVNTADINHEAEEAQGGQAAETDHMTAVRERINELAAKAKTAEGLTTEEEAERAELRAEFLANFRKAFRSQVEMLQVFDDDGNEVTPEKVREIQRDKGIRDN